MQQQAAATQTVASSCFQELREKPEYAELLTKLYMAEDSLNYPLAYLTNPARPAKKDLTSLFAFHAGLQACRKLLLDGSVKNSSAHRLGSGGGFYRQRQALDRVRIRKGDVG